MSVFIAMESQRPDLVQCMPKASHKHTITTAWDRYTVSSEIILYSGKFSRGPNFRDFRNPRPKRENKNRENLNR